jgi:uncharacterized SAM-binding protein YcdF (DUF218 family)
MTLILFILLLLTALVTCLKYRKLAIIFLSLSILLFWGTGSGLVGQCLLSPLQINNTYDTSIQWGKHNALVVLGAGTTKNQTTNIIFPGIMGYPRIDATAMSYLDCKKSHSDCTVIVSGGDPLKNGETEARVYQQYLHDLGVNAGDIILEDKSGNTFQNAQYSSEILKKHNFDQVFLITSGFHMQRALLYFTHFDIKPIPLPADYTNSHYSIWPRGYNFAIADYALHEHLGIARYYFYNFMGWND